MEAFKKSLKNLTAEDFGLAVYNSGYQKCKPEHSWGPAIKDHYLIHYISSGHGIFKFDGNTYSLSEGDLFIIFPHNLTYYIADKEEPWEYYWVGFNGTQAKRLINLTPFEKSKPIIKTDDYSDYKEAGGEIIKKHLKETLLRIYKSGGNMPFNEVSMSGYLHLFLAELIKISNKKPDPNNTGSEYVRKAMQFIQHNYAEFIGVEDIAKFAGISRSHLCRIFAREANMSPSEFLQNHRISEACSLLRKSKLSIHEIANSVGFSDPLYFSRIFKKIKGVSPSKYNEMR